MDFNLFSNLFICQILFFPHSYIHFLLARSRTCFGTLSAEYHWLRYFGDSFAQTHTWVLCLVVSIWIVSYQSSFNCSVLSRSRGHNLKQSGNGTPVINSGTWFQASFMSNLWWIWWNRSKPIYPYRGKFSEFQSEFGEILSRTDVIFPDLVLVVFWSVERISNFWGWILSIYPWVHV